MILFDKITFFPALKGDNTQKDLVKLTTRSKKQIYSIIFLINHLKIPLLYLY